MFCWLVYLLTTNLQNKPGRFIFLLVLPSSSVFSLLFPHTRPCNLPAPAKQANFFILPQSTYKDAKTEHGNSWRLAERQQQEKQRRAQLHQVEQVIVCKEVGSECFGIFRVSEELVIIFSFLRQQE